ncbi:DUF1642 domain-containing protein [Streptococcus uberis]|uniref:DUF1642 domain-containing protein n=1 Tax=Streptococcus uberis TaxID=1349 RepID=UPI000E039243|nr:DUF1642 domain-containing protein [Streptococcus uberis]SUO88762.1 Protein of uncharacterised function (DUF1642) [Streptococcus uberis]
MKIEEAKIRFEEIETYTHGFYDDVLIKKSDAKVLLDQIELDQPKPVVPQVAIDYYNEYKNVLSSFDEWFCGFYDDKFDEEFEKAEELRIWLYDNDNKINLQHELALATLIVNGPDAVTVEKEKLYTVVIPNPHEKQLSYVLMRRPNGNVIINVVHSSNLDLLKTDNDLQLTEKEIKKDFDWAFRWAEEVTE